MNDNTKNKSIRLEVAVIKPSTVNSILLKYVNSEGCNVEIVDGYTYYRPFDKYIDLIDELTNNKESIMINVDSFSTRKIIFKTKETSYEFEIVSYNVNQLDIKDAILTMETMKERNVFLPQDLLNYFDNFFREKNIFNHIEEYVSYYDMVKKFVDVLDRKKTDLNSPLYKPLEDIVLFTINELLKYNLDKSKLYEYMVNLDFTMDLDTLTIEILFPYMIMSPKEISVILKSSRSPIGRVVFIKDPLYFEDDTPPKIKNRLIYGNIKLWSSNNFRDVREELSIQTNTYMRGW